VLSKTQKATPSNIFSHWHRSFEGIQVTPSAFYDSIEAQINEREIPGIKIKRVNCSEGGAMSAKRIYLRVKRKDIMFDICGAPFGKGFFVSWWLGEKPWGLIKRTGVYLLYVPFVSYLIRGFYEKTYYKIDTMLMYQEQVVASVAEVMNAFLEAEGLKPLTEQQVAPEMKL
jgi:hypothetical protein